MVVKCCVPGCVDPSPTKRLLPIAKEEMYKIWMQHIKNQKITLNLDKKVAYRRYLVCDKHFDDPCRLPGEKRLPTLFLPGFSGASDQQNCLYRNFCQGQCTDQDRVELPLSSISEYPLSPARSQQPYTYTYAEVPTHLNNKDRDRF